MSYTKHAWVTGETITAEKLNNIEDGVDDLNRQLSDVEENKIPELKNAINQKQDATNYVTLSGTIVTQTGADNTMYLCGELAELTFTAPATGITAVRFTSGTTPTVVTLNGITMPDDWTGAEASTTYEINVLNGLGAWQSWT